VDVRFLAATNKDLSKMVSEGKFREDLFFRLNVFTVYLPPLRDRREDIPLLVAHFIERLGINISVSAECMAVLTASDWAGNIRELENAVKAASVLAQDVIEPMHLPVTVTHQRGKTRPALVELPEDLDLDCHLKDVEKEMIIEALTKAGGVQSMAAKHLGIKDRSLWHRVKKFGIDVTAFKQGSSR
jgi:transcriptional regulator with GAF, ATPase, and Fis domain